jgi:hypothetical protein
MPASYFDGVEQILRGTELTVTSLFHYGYIRKEAGRRQNDVKVNARFADVRLTPNYGGQPSL